MTDEQIVLLGGLWLDAASWDGVVAELTTRGRRAVAAGAGEAITGSTVPMDVSAVKYVRPTAITI